jgi:hypothetical protein
MSISKDKAGSQQEKESDEDQVERDSDFHPTEKMNHSAIRK